MPKPLDKNYPPPSDFVLYDRGDKTRFGVWSTDGQYYPRPDPD